MADAICTPTKFETRSAIIQAYAKETTRNSKPVDGTKFALLPTSSDSSVPSFVPTKLELNEINPDRMKRSSKDSISSLSWDTSSELSISKTLPDLIAAMFLTTSDGKEVFMPSKPGDMTTFSYMVYKPNVKQSQLLMGSIPKSIVMTFQEGAYSKLDISWGASREVAEFDVDQPFETEELPASPAVATHEIQEILINDQPVAFYSKGITITLDAGAQESVLIKGVSLSYGQVSVMLSGRILLSDCNDMQRYAIEKTPVKIDVKIIEPQSGNEMTFNMPNATIGQVSISSESNNIFTDFTAEGIFNAKGKTDKEKSVCSLEFVLNESATRLVESVPANEKTEEA